MYALSNDFGLQDELRLEIGQNGRFLTICENTLHFGHMEIPCLLI